jgi:hypothetical protein
MYRGNKPIASNADRGQFSPFSPPAAPLAAAKQPVLAVPIEIYELAKQFTLVKLAVTAINAADRLVLGCARSVALKKVKDPTHWPPFGRDRPHGPAGPPL